jgi:hypothetical protein
MMKHNIQKIFIWKTYEMVPRSAINRLDEIKVETLFLPSEKESDDLFQIAALYKTIPSIKIIHIPNANHIITLTHPEEVSKRIIQFLK